MQTEEQQQEQQPQQQREPRRNPLTAGETAHDEDERDLRMGAHPIQGERENDAFRV